MKNKVGRMRKKRVTDMDVANKRVLVRVDFNVPKDRDGYITDDTRIRATLPTINRLREQKARIILLSHLGRPKGQVVDSLRLASVARRLEELLDRPVLYVQDDDWNDVGARLAGIKPGEVALVENIRFHSGEERNDPELSRILAGLGDVFINDAFGVSHRAHASTVGVAQLLPSAAGLLLTHEIEMLSRAVKEPERPFVALIGGAKVSDKIGVIKNLLLLADAVLVGGGMANTFLLSKGHPMGLSLVEEDKLDEAQSILEQAMELGRQLVLPEDLVVAAEFSPAAARQTVAVDAVPDDWSALDIGEKTVEIFAEYIARARTVVWNGPVGVFELEPFAEGTEAMAVAVSQCPGTTIVGGGDSIAALEKLGLTDRVTHVSTGGGASLEFLEGRELPGIAVLDDVESGDGG